MNEALWLELARLLIPIVTPLLVSGIRYGVGALVGRLPKVWLPVLAPVIGGTIAGLTGATDPATGAVLGLAGVGAREIVDQGVKAMKGTASP